jgi:glycosyltransferase involved in cell wall biosynthesis
MLNNKTEKFRNVLIIVENLPVPFDRRVWQEALTLREAGYTVSVICPQGKGYAKRYEQLEGIHIYRHPLPLEGSGAFGYVLEYSLALFWEFWLSLKVLRQRGFDVIQACNPPDDIFLIGGFYKLFFGKKFIFDHHDINPELYEAKFGQKGFAYKIMLFLERITFRTADISIATNESYRRIAIERGCMDPDRVYVVRSGPSLERMKVSPPNPVWKNGRKYMVGYVGVMGQQEGIDHLLEAARILVYDLNRQDIQFCLIGGGTELNRMQDMSVSYGLKDYVTFTGRIPDQHMLEILSTADVCVNPDKANPMNDKSTMNKVMEYMALGKPIVQYDLTEGRFSARAASVYARPNDVNDLAIQIQSLLDDPEKRMQMGSFGQKRVYNELHWGIESRKYLTAYDKLSRLT